MTNDELKAWAALGPWRVSDFQQLSGHYKVCHTGLDYGLIANVGNGDRQLNERYAKANAALIAAAPTLAAEVLRLRKEIADQKNVTDRFVANHPDLVRAIVRDIGQALKGQDHDVD